MHKFKSWYKFLFLSSLVVTVLAQLFLLNDSIKGAMSHVYRLESKYVFSEQMQPMGTITLEVSESSVDKLVLQNGEPVAKFDKNKLTIDVLDNTVVEIDGRNCEKEFWVKVNYVSDNIGGYYEEKIYVNGNIAVLGRFFVK